MGLLLGLGWWVLIVFKRLGISISSIITYSVLRSDGFLRSDEVGVTEDDACVLSFVAALDLSLIHI